MWERRPNFVVHCGDVVDNGAAKAQWTGDLFRPCNELFGRVAVFPCIGNHEKNHAHYYKYFALPETRVLLLVHLRQRRVLLARHQQEAEPQAGRRAVQVAREGAGGSDREVEVVLPPPPGVLVGRRRLREHVEGPSTTGDVRVRQLGDALREVQGGRGVQRPHPRVRADVADPRREGGPEERGRVRHDAAAAAGRWRTSSPTPAFFKQEFRSDYHFCYVTVHNGTFNLKAFDHEGRLFDQFTLKKE